MKEGIRQNFSGERLSHEFLNLGPHNFFQLLIDHNLSPRVAVHIRENHLQRYMFADSQIRAFENRTAVNSLNILDLACGIGYGSNLISKKGRKVIGIDKSSTTIKEADIYYGGSNIQFLEGNGENLFFQNDSFHIITCFETLEHMDSPETMLQETVRVLNSNGELYLSTPNRAVTNPSATSDDQPPNKFHKHEYNIEELCNLLSKFFNEVDILGQEQYPDISSIPERILFHLGEPGIFTIKMRDMLRLYKTAQVEPLKPDHKPTYLIAICRNKKVLK